MELIIYTAKGAFVGLIGAATTVAGNEALQLNLDINTVIIVAGFVAQFTYSIQTLNRLIKKIDLLEIEQANHIKEYHSKK